MKQDLCPSRDFGPHIFEDGVCVMCLAPIPKPCACEICAKPMSEKEAQEAMWEQGMILCERCIRNEEIWGRMDDSAEEQTPG